MTPSQKHSSSRTDSSVQDHLNIVHPDVGKRYRLNFTGEVNRLSIGKIKQCLATASTCAIPLDKMVLKLNGVPLSDERDICGALGIGCGTTLSVEHIKHVEPYLHRHVDVYGHDNVLDHMGSYVSPKRRQLEIQTVREQEWCLRRDAETQERVLQDTLGRIDEELYSAQIQRQRLERHRTLAEQGLLDVSRKESQTQREKESFASLLAQETERAAQRAADLELRREKLRRESEAIRAVSMQKLALEEHKAKLAEEKAQFKAEQIKVEQEQRMFETLAKEREAQILTQEIELEHAQLAQSRQKQELEVQRRIALEQKMNYYQQLGLPVKEERSYLQSSSSHLYRPPAPAMPSVSFTGTDDERRRNDRFEEPAGSTPHSVSTPISCRDIADENLRLLGESLEAPSLLRFDANRTCVFTVGSQYSLLVNFDESTNWLSLYSTLVTSIPQEDPNLCLELFTLVLEGLQPGSSRATGGLGASFHEGSIVLSVGIYLPSSQPWALKMIAPPFVQCLQEWRRRIAEFMQSRAASAEAKDDKKPLSFESTRDANGSESVVLGLEVTDTLLVNGVSTVFSEGVIVVNASGPAADAGVERNDWIKCVNQQVTSTKEAFQQVVQQLRRNEEVEVELERRGNMMTVRINV